MVAFRAGGQAAPGKVAQWLSPSGAAPVVLMADVSEFQPGIDDAKYLAWSKAMVIRAAYGDAHDDGAWYGGQRRADLHKGGVLFLGIYQFLVAGQDGTAQANALHDLTGGLQQHEVIVADFEQGGHPMLSAWYNRMLALGYPEKYLWTYTGLDFGQGQGALPVQWLAAYGQDEPSSPHTLWQFSPSYPVPGVGTADCSVFHGTIEQLSALAYPGAAAPPQLADATPAPVHLTQSVRASGYTAALGWSAVPGVPSYHFQLQYLKGGIWVMYLDEHVAVSSVSVGMMPGATRWRWRVAAGESNYIWTGWEEFATS